MSDTIIRVENISKRYVLGHQRAKGDGLRHVLDMAMRNPLRWLKNHKQNFTKEKEEFWALKDVSFEVKQGEVIGIIGRNGAGKSTLLKILSRIVEPTSGRIELNGRVASLLEVGTGFHPELTGRENIFLNGAILGMSRVEIKRKFDEIVDFSEVEKFLDTPVKRYSSGMYVRLAFAVAAHLEPEILIVDEVLAVGDAEFQKKCLGKMGQVSREGRTVLFVSHNMVAVKALCQHGILLDNGFVKSVGPADSITREYLNTGQVNGKWEKTWPEGVSAPGNKTIKLRRVAVAPAANGIGTNDCIDISVPLDITVDFSNSTPGAVLNVSLVLYTQDDACVLNTWTKALPREAGMYRAICHIPGNFLNDESYRVRVLLVENANKPILDQDHLITFDLRDVDRDGSWFGKVIGVVRPTIPWSEYLLNT